MGKGGDGVGEEEDGGGAEVEALSAVNEVVVPREQGFGLLFDLSSLIQAPRFHQTPTIQATSTSYCSFPSAPSSPGFPTTNVSLWNLIVIVCPSGSVSPLSALTYCSLSVSALPASVTPSFVAP